MPPSSVIRVRRLRRTVALLWLLVPMVLAGCGNGSAGLPDFTELVDRVAPAVVNISVVPRGAPSSGQQAPGSAREDWLKQYFHDRPPSHGPSLPSLGSGFIISEDGYILTAGHVVSAPGRIVVKLQDRRQLEAKLVGSDEYSDIALLKVDASDLPTVAIGDVDVLEVGAWVIAIGSPFGFETSVTAGIVSAKRRSLSHDQYVPFIQTDVAINPGNSGGPLFNMAGEVVGVNSQIYSRNGGFQGVSFAIPIDIAMGVAQQLRRGEGIKRGWLGVQIQEVDLGLAQSFGLSRPEGALVSRVLPGSPAEAAGFQAGDIILVFDGHPVKMVAALPPLVGRTTPGAQVQVEVLRAGQRQTLAVTLGSLAGESPPGMHAPQHQPELPDLGLSLRDLTPGERHKLGLASGGVLVEKVQSGGLGQQAGLQAGDVIAAVGSQPVAGVTALRQQLAKAHGPVALRVLRGGAALYVPLDLKSGR